MKRKPRAKSAQWKPNLEGAWVSWVTIGFGQQMWFLYVPNHCAPVGFVWGQPSDGCFEVFGSFVPPFSRRCGVRTRINREILQSYPTITTRGGSKDGGLAFLKASGYKRNRDLHCWYLKKKESVSKRART